MDTAVCVLEWCFEYQAGDLDLVDKFVKEASCAILATLLGQILESTSSSFPPSAFPHSAASFVLMGLLFSQGPSLKGL